MSLDALDTPALLVDLDIMEANIARVAETCRARGVAWRPHFKGHKTIEIAKKQIAAGAIGLTCAKLGEAEVLADAGIRDLMIANQIVGPIKMRRLAALLDRADVIVSVDSEENVRELADAVQGKSLRVVIEVNTGMNRAGVEPGEPCLALAKFIAGKPGLQFAGLMGWEGHAAPLDADIKTRAVTAAVRSIVQSAEMCRAAGLPVAIVSCGGTGTYWLSAAQPGITEIQAGGGVFCDVHYRKDFGVEHPYALTVMTSVSSRPTPTRIVCDAGKKTMSTDASMPAPIGLDHIRSVRLSAEHATIELDAPNTSLRVGDRLEWVAGYSDTTVHLHDEIYGVRKGRIEAVWPIVGRGKLR